QRGTMCPRCTTEKELESAPRRVKCEGCGQPLATIATDLPGDLRRVCSNRCAQRWRRRRQAERRPLATCAGCGEAFRQPRDDTRFCSNKCRQSAYRQRISTGAAVEPKSYYDRNDAIHLDDIGGVLHYQGTAIIAIDRLPRGWPGYGNRYVMALIDHNARA